MNYRVFCLIFICFFLYVSENYAMQPSFTPITSTMSEEKKIVTSLRAIACNDQGDIVFTDEFYYSIINYTAPLPRRSLSPVGREHISRGKIHTLQYEVYCMIRRMNIFSDLQRIIAEKFLGFKKIK